MADSSLDAIAEYANQLSRRYNRGMFLGTYLSAVDTVVGPDQTRVTSYRIGVGHAQAASLTDVGQFVYWDDASQPPVSDWKITQMPISEDGWTDFPVEAYKEACDWDNPDRVLG